MTGSYIGRFAPSPTGPLHFGSLLAAVASYLDARKQQGKWLVRIEDLDKPREQAGAADHIVRTLHQYGMTADEPIVYQSQRLPAYQQALQQLTAYTYPCACSRRQLQNTAHPGALGLIYPGTCRQHPPPTETQRYAIRVRVADRTIHFTDRIQGDYQQNLAHELGDFIIRRADHLFAYQLAVVVDDDWQKVSHIVRGMDLLDNTPRQIYLQQCLGYSTPQYLHIPLADNPDGQKLSKQNLARALNPRRPVQDLCQTLCFLGHPAQPQAAEFSSLNAFWDWAIAHWNPAFIPALHSKPAPEGYY